MGSVPPTTPGVSKILPRSPPHPSTPHSMKVTCPFEIGQQVNSLHLLITGRVATVQTTPKYPLQPLEMLVPTYQTTRWHNTQNINIHFGKTSNNILEAGTLYFYHEDRSNISLRNIFTHHQSTGSYTTGDMNIRRENPSHFRSRQ
jgi:hypothetical protein